MWFGLIGSSLDAKLLAYPEGLPEAITQRQASKPCATGFAEQIVDDVPTEKAELKLYGGTWIGSLLDQALEGCASRGRLVH